MQSNNCYLLEILLLFVYIFLLSKNDFHRENKFVCFIIRINSCRSTRPSPLRSAACSMDCNSSSLKFNRVC